MNPTQKTIKRLFLSIAISVAALIAGTSSAAAQSEACIQNNATVSTTLRVLANDVQAPIDSPFDTQPGGTTCVSLDPVPDGTGFIVLALFAGNSAECGGNFNNLTRSASLQTSIFFYVSGTDLHPHCTAPTSAQLKPRA
jgi:hypothetical protein